MQYNGSDKEMRATPDSNASSEPVSIPIGQISETKTNPFHHFIDGFRRDPDARPLVLHDQNDPRTARTFDAEGAAENTARSPLARKLQGRHLQMIAIGQEYTNN